MMESNNVVNFIFQEAGGSYSTAGCKMLIDTSICVDVRLLGTWPRGSPAWTEMGLED